MIVVDASAIVELLTLSELGARVALRLRGEVLHAPAHLDAEVVGALRRAVLRDQITRHEALDAVVTLGSMRIERWPLPPLSPTVLGHMDAVTVADGYYVVLAEALDVPLVTCDARLSRSHGHGASVDLVVDARRR